MEEQLKPYWDQGAQWLSDPVHAWSAGAALLLYLLGCCSICARAGWPWILGLVLCLPGLNVVLFLLLAFAPWPVRNELYHLRRLDHSVAVAAKRYSRAA